MKTASSNFAVSVLLKPLLRAGATALAVMALHAPFAAHAATKAVVLGWNNLGMHCMDSDYSVFSILPPFNTVDAQVVVAGKLVTARQGYTVTYEAMADPDGSINRSSAGKGNFYQFASVLYGNVAPDKGLAGFNMPGPANTPQKFGFDTNYGVFEAPGIPITPYDDQSRKNTYPMMRLTARKGTRVMATTDVVLPVSDEMDCRACHGSGTQLDAQPPGGWVNSPNAERDYRLNILKLHDSRRGAGYAAVLKAAGYNTNGLFANVVNDGRPVLCARCHLSEALPGTGIAGVSPLTAAVHSRHAAVRDPDLNLTLGNANHRAACYRCHPGSTTRCLRGAMGAATADDGSMVMQCQSCHGTMSAVGSRSRTGWLDEPGCGACHTGTATKNSGQVRFTSVFDAPGHVRVPADQTFATTANAPAAGLSLYRFSTGHGGMKCSACHGSTHAEYPSLHRNDNIQSIKLQGHAGVIAECSVCHATTPKNYSGGPHGLHPIGQGWARSHGDAGKKSLTQCAACHGADFRGTVLSKALADRVFSTEHGVVRIAAGTSIGCYTCHNGPSGEEDISGTED